MSSQRVKDSAPKADNEHENKKCKWQWDEQKGVTRLCWNKANNPKESHKKQVYQGKGKVNV